MINQDRMIFGDLTVNSRHKPGGGRPQINLKYVLPLKYVQEVCRTSIEVRIQPHFGLIGHSLVVSPFICNTLFYWSNRQSLSNDNQATKFTGVLTLLEAIFSTVRLRVQQEVNIFVNLK